VSTVGCPGELVSDRKPTRALANLLASELEGFVRLGSDNESQIIRLEAEGYFADNADFVIIASI
jgi:hypothetical protein